MIKAGPKQTKTPIGIAQILMNLSIGFKKYSLFGRAAQLLIAMVSGVGSIERPVVKETFIEMKQEVAVHCD